MNSNENLKNQLSAWKVDVEIPCRFQADVWTQIAAREGSGRPIWERFADWFAVAFYKPHMAAAMLTFGLTFGVGVAYFRAQDSNAIVGHQLEARYIQTINPLAHGGRGS